MSDLNRDGTVDERNLLTVLLNIDRNANTNPAEDVEIGIEMKCGGEAVDELADDGTGADG